MSLLDRVREIRVARLAKIAPIAYPEVPAPVYEKAAFEPQIVPTEGVIPQIVSKWARAFLKPEYLKKSRLSPQITELNLIGMVADVRDRVVKTATQLFPRLKEVFGE